MSIYRMAFAYAMIRKSDNYCFQVIHTNTENWSIDDDYAFSVEVTESISDSYLDKYYYAAESSEEKTWWTRTWNEYDEDGNPVESAGYVDTPWTPGE